MSSQLLPGQRFRGYVIEAEASRGGMGVVYRARDATLGRPVALKVLPPESNGGTDETHRLLREAQLAAQLAHPSIVVVHEAGAENGIAFVAMEWVDGTSLDAIIDSDLVPLERRLAILEEVAQALAFAHARSVIHRDVKPSNVMLDAHGRARLLDFGIARRMPGAPLAGNGATGPAAFATRAGVIMGTPRYMAPEQMIGAIVDARADQFAWGVLAYEILARVHPREAVPQGSGEFPAARPPPIGWRRPEVSDAITAVVLRAMAYDPSARFSSMEELLGNLRAARSPTLSPDALRDPRRGATSGPITSHGPATGPLGSASGPFLPPGPSPYAPTQPYVAAAPAPSSNRLLVFALVGGLGAFLLLGLGGGVAFYLASQDGKGTTPPGAGMPAPPSFGPGKTRIESGVDDLPFATPKPDVAKVKSELEGRLASCFGAGLSRDHTYSADVWVARDGRVSNVTDLNVCQETSTPSHYICTERGEPKPKPKYPRAPDSVFACMDKTLRATKFPPLKVTDPERTTLHIELK